MNEKELVTALQNITVDSNTAMVIAEKYIQYKYFELAFGGVLMLPFLALIAFVIYRLTKEDL